MQLADSGRRHPGAGSSDYDTFMANLVRAGYAGRMSVELVHELTDEEKAHSLRFLRAFWPA